MAGLLVDWVTMKPTDKCKVCGRTAQNLTDNWGQAPCLHGLDEPNPNCLEHIITQKIRRK